MYKDYIYISYIYYKQSQKTKQHAGTKRKKMFQHEEILMLYS